MISSISIGKPLQSATCARGHWRVDNTGKQVLLPGQAAVLAKLPPWQVRGAGAVWGAKAGKSGWGQGLAWSGNLAKLTSSSVSWLRCIEKS